MRGKGEEGEKPAFYAIMQEFMHKRKTQPTKNSRSKCGTPFRSCAGHHPGTATGKAPTAGRTERRHRLPRQDADRQPPPEPRPQLLQDFRKPLSAVANSQPGRANRQPLTQPGRTNPSQAGQQAKQGRRPLASKPPPQLLAVPR